MYVSMGHMIGLPTFEFLNMHTHPISYSIALLILTIPFIIYGFDIIKSGLKNLIHKAPNMDTLVAIGVLSSLLYSIYNMYMLITGNHSYVEHLYFESNSLYFDKTSTVMLLLVSLSIKRPKPFSPTILFD